MKDVIKPFLLSTILGLVGCSGKEAIAENQPAELANQAKNITSGIDESSSGYNASSEDTIHLTLSTYEVSVTELAIVELDYQVESTSQNYFALDVISYDKDIISASIEKDKIVIEANAADFDTYTYVDVVAADGSDIILATIAVEVLPRTEFAINVEQTNVQINFLDTYYVPFSIEYDGDEEVNLSIEDVEGNTFATVNLESSYSLNNTLIIQGNGVYQSGTLSFNVVASTDSGAITVPVTVDVFPEVNINIDLSNDSPTFNKADSSFTIVRVCTDVSDDYELEISEISGNGSVNATLEGSVISITSADIEYDTTATFMVTASILGVSEVAYFDVLVEAE